MTLSMEASAALLTWIILADIVQRQCAAPEVGACLVDEDVVGDGQEPGAKRPGPAVRDW
jgi:hypothetical protein